MSNFQKGSLATARIEAARKWDYAQPQVQHTGDKITLPSEPEAMSLLEASRILKKLDDQENQAVSVQEKVNCITYDGVVAFSRAIQHLFGMTIAQSTMGFFGPKPPTTLSIPTGPDAGDAVICIVGAFSVPALPDGQTVHLHMIDTGIAITCSTTRRHENIVRMIAKCTIEFLRTQSIYKGKALRVEDTEAPPEFIKLTDLSFENIILNEHVRTLVNTTIFTPILHTDKCRELQVPLKRGVLLEGPYGTGKSLISSACASECVKQGWTFITSDNSANLAHLLEMARSLQPCVVFVEDIDRSVQEGRDDTANTILNTLDGILSKSSETMVIMTTNHVEKIGRAMLRPGRLDAVISMELPDAPSIVKLLKMYGQNSLRSDFNYAAVSVRLEGMIPATIREVVERSKLHTVARSITGEIDLISTEDVVATAQGMKRHMELLSPLPPAPVSDLAAALAVVGEKLFGNNASAFAQVGELNKTLKSISHTAASAESLADMGYEKTKEVLDVAKEIASNI